MKLKELVNKTDNDIVLWIVRAPDTNVLFKRYHERRGDRNPSLRE